MKEVQFDFPQAITDVQHVTCFRFVSGDYKSDLCTLEDPDEFLNENVPTDKAIAVILKDESFYCGMLAGIDDEKEFMVKIRSITNRSCVVSISFGKILGWCLLPNHYEP